MTTRWIRAATAAIAISVALLGGPVLASDGAPDLKSSAFMVLDEETGEILASKNTDAVVPIASITKLMTAIVTLDAALPLDDQIAITDEDIDTLKGTRSRLRVGSVFSRDDMLKLALMASENRAASALGRSYPGGLDAFVQAMNAKAQTLGMNGTHFVEPTGLSSSNVSSVEDLVKLVREAHRHTLIREYSTLASHEVEIGGRRTAFINTNGLVRGGNWDIGLSKTGFINEAGRCLVMQAKVAARSVIIVLLDSWGKYTRIGDANRIRQWLEPDFEPPVVRQVSNARPKATAKPVRSSAAAKGGRVKVQIKAGVR